MVNLVRVLRVKMPSGDTLDLFPCSPEINWVVPQLPKDKNEMFLM